MQYQILLQTQIECCIQYSVTKHTLKMRKSVSSSIQTLTSDTLNTGERVLSNFQTLTKTTLNTREHVYPIFKP